MEDCEIIELYFARNESAISETDRKYGRFCSNVSRNIVRDDMDVEECVNDAYLHTWNSIPPTRPISLMAYLAKLVRNISLNVLKARNTKKRGSGEYELVYDEISNVVPSNESVEDVYEGISLKDLLNRWLDSLPAEHRMVFVGRYWFFDSISTISVKMGYSESKTKMLLLRLREKLKEYLESEEIHL